MAFDDKIKNGVEKIDQEYQTDVSGQLAQLREDLANLAGTVKTLGSDVKNDVKAKASRVADDAISASNSAARTVKHEIRSLNDTVTDHVQTNPIQALGIAAAAGFLLAIITRR